MPHYLVQGISQHSQRVVVLAQNEIAIDEIVRGSIHCLDLRDSNVISRNQLVALALECLLGTGTVEHGKALRFDVLEVAVEQSIEHAWLGLLRIVPSGRAMPHSGCS